MSQILAPPVALPRPVLEVQNKQATVNEYNVAYALTSEGFEYIFRATYFGGRRIRGGVEVDFLVLAPFPTPLEVFGDYWHTGQFDAADKLRLQILFRHFNVQPKVIWGNESETLEEARSAVRKVFRL